MDKPNDIKYQNVSPETIDRIEAFKKVTKEIIAANGSRDFLIQTGVYTKEGKLSKIYR
jgi:hypothetical protein